MDLNFNRTSADGSYAGYEYQFLVFLKEVLSLHKDEKAGFEFKDDVHTVTASGETILIQTKHTIQTKAKGSAINLTNLDPDLWKTITNWMSLFCDPQYSIFKANRVENSNQTVNLKTSVEKYSFVLKTNKNTPIDATYLSIFSNATLESKRGRLMALIKSTSDKEIKLQIEYLNSLPDRDFQLFTSKVTIISDDLVVIAQIKNKLREKYVSDNRMDILLASIYTRLKEYTSDAIERGEKVEIDFEGQFRLLKKYFEFAGSKFNPLKRMFSPPPELQGNLSELTFIRQLVDIECINEQQFADLAGIMFDFQSYLRQNFFDGEIIQEQIEQLDQNATLIWDAIFQANYDSTNTERKKHLPDNEEAIKAIARQVYFSIKKEQIAHESLSLDTKLNFGEFLGLSNLPKIGWHIDWERRYAK